MSDHKHHHHGSSGNLRLAFFLNLGFTIIEFAGGLWTNSIAILADSVHDLGDSISLGLAWYFERISSQEADPQHTYGYRRYRLLGGLIAGITLLVGISFVIYHSVGRLMNPGEIKVHGMLWIAVAGVIFNGLAVLRLKQGTSLTERIVSWHLWEDLLGWIAVLAGAVIMMIWNVPVIDPLISLGISGFVLWNVIRNLREVFDVILQKSPGDFDVAEFETSVLEIEEVNSVHHIHSWSIDGESHVLSLHVVLSADAEHGEVKQCIRRLVSDSFEHVSIEIVEGDFCPVQKR